MGKQQAGNRIPGHDQVAAELRLAFRAGDAALTCRDNRIP
jgi:hypothetical protein